MKELILDSATNVLFVGLIKDNDNYQLTRIGKNDNAAYMVDMVREILEENNTKIDELDNIIVGIGPGSYTGTRVAVTVAKIFSYTKDINLKTISSLNLLTSGYKENNINVALDARRGFYFVGRYQNGNALEVDKYINLDDLKDYIVLTNDNIKIDLNIVSKVATLIDNIHELVPNYLRKTEAENNYDQKNND